MPRAADVGFLIRFFTHLRNDRMGVRGLEETVDVDLAPLLGKSNVLFLSKFLIPEKDHPLVAEHLTDF